MNLQPLSSYILLIHSTVLKVSADSRGCGVRPWSQEGKIPTTSQNLLQNSQFNLPGPVGGSPVLGWRPFGGKAYPGFRIRLSHIVLVVVAICVRHFMVIHTNAPWCG